MSLIFSRIVPALILGLFIYVAYVVMTNRYVPEPPLKSFTNWQEADAPLGIPINSSSSKAIQKFNPQFHLHSAFERALIPTAPRFDAPMGSESGALTYNAQPFWEQNNLRGGRHTGDDINGIGGQNSDLGDPIFAIANGLVIYSGTPSKGWGKTVILAHRTTDGRIIHSMYAHMDTIHVAYMNQIPRGAIIGTVGTADQNYLAHLHLEMRHADGISPQTGYSAFKFDRLNPEETIQTLNTTDPDDLSPSILQIVQSENKKKLQLPSMDSESALRLQEFLNKKTDDHIKPFSTENQKYWTDPNNTTTATWLKGQQLEISYGDSINGLRWTGPLPTPPYEISLQARRIDGVDFFCGLTFPVRSEQENATLILGGWGGSQVGISSINEQDASRNETSQIIAFEKNKWQHIHLTVTKSHIKVLLNQKQIINLPLAEKKLSLRPGPITPFAPLSLTTFQTTAEFKNLKWRSLAEPPSE